MAGLVIGTIAGMSGIGGSALLAPVLILLLGVKPSIAVGTDLVYSVPMKLLAAFAHARQRTIDRTAITWLALGGIPGAIVGLIAYRLVRVRLDPASFEDLVRHAIGIVILCSVAASIIASILRRRVRVGTTRSGAAIAATGAVVGFLVSVTSIGSGSITLPLLMLLLPRIALRELIGSEIVFAAIILPISAAGHAAFSDVDWRLTLSLTVGAVPGAYLGASLTARLSDSVLRPIVIAVLAYAGFSLL